MTSNRQWQLASRPSAEPDADTFSYVEGPMPTASDGEVLVKVLYASLDPAMRGWLVDRKSYVPPVQIGEVMRAIAVGVVLESKAEGYAPGDKVSGLLGVQEYCAGAPKPLNLRKLPDAGLPLPRFLGALGMPGMTAYFGLLEVGKPEPGNTVVVSAAAGAVGSVVGQIAKIKGCRVVGIAGGAEKCAHVVETFGFDACVDYKNEDVRKALKRECPDGIDVYFDNVGGDILDAALANLAMHARIVICGAISQYNHPDDMQGPKNYLSLLVHRASMTGMVVFDYANDYAAAGMQMAQWMMGGQLQAEEHIVDGIETFPQTLMMLFSGGNRGKLVLRIAADGDGSGAA